MGIIPFRPITENPANPSTITPNQQLPLSANTQQISMVGINSLQHPNRVDTDTDIAPEIPSPETTPSIITTSQENCCIRQLSSDEQPASLGQQSVSTEHVDSTNRPIQLAEKNNYASLDGFDHKTIAEKSDGGIPTIRSNDSTATPSTDIHILSNPISNCTTLVTSDDVLPQQSVCCHSPEDISASPVDRVYVQSHENTLNICCTANDNKNSETGNVQAEDIDPRQMSCVYWSNNTTIPNSCIVPNLNRILTVFNDENNFNDSNVHVAPTETVQSFQINSHNSNDCRISPALQDEQNMTDVTETENSEEPLYSSNILRSILKSNLISNQKSTISTQPPIGDCDEDDNDNHNLTNYTEMDKIQTTVRCEEPPPTPGSTIFTTLGEKGNDMTDTEITLECNEQLSQTNKRPHTNYNNVKRIKRDISDNCTLHSNASDKKCIKQNVHNINNVCSEEHFTINNNNYKLIRLNYHKEKHSFISTIQNKNDTALNHFNVNQILSNDNITTCNENDDFENLIRANEIINKNHVSFYKEISANSREITQIEVPRCDDSTAVIRPNPSYIPTPTAADTNTGWEHDQGEQQSSKIVTFTDDGHCEKKVPNKQRVPINHSNNSTLPKVSKQTRKQFVLNIPTFNSLQNDEPVISKIDLAVRKRKLQRENAKLIKDRVHSRSEYEYNARHTRIPVSENNNSIFEHFKCDFKNGMNMSVDSSTCPDVRTLNNVNSISLSSRLLSKVFLDPQSDDSTSDIDSPADKDVPRSKLWVTCGPPIKLDTRKDKMHFLEIFGLTSYARKNDRHLLQLNKQKWRSRWNPILYEYSQKACLDLPIPNMEPDTLNSSPDFPEKSCFFRELGLRKIQNKQREELEEIWLKILKYRSGQGHTSALTTYCLKAASVARKKYISNRHQGNSSQCQVPKYYRKSANGRPHHVSKYPQVNKTTTIPVLRIPDRSFKITYEKQQLPVDYNKCEEVAQRQVSFVPNIILPDNNYLLVNNLWPSFVKIEANQQPSQGIVVQQIPCVNNNVSNFVWPINNTTSNSKLKWPGTEEILFAYKDYSKDRENNIEQESKRKVQLCEGMKTYQMQIEFLDRRLQYLQNLHCLLNENQVKLDKTLDIYNKFLNVFR